MVRAIIVALLVAAVLPLVIERPASGQAQSDFVDETVVGGFGQGVSLDWMNDGRAIVIGKWGQLYVANPSTGAQYSYMYIGSDIDSSGERGLLDVVVDKNFASNKFYYLYYSDTSSRLTIARYKFTGNGTNDRASKTVLWQNPGPLHSSFGPYHIGGSLNIGNDGKFYLSVGDGFQPQNSGKLTNVFGKILRINLNGSVPTDNPFYDGTGPNIDEIWAYGLRNPFRASFDAPTGRYFIGDVGGNDAPTAYEEVNLGLAGRNYGWPTCEGPLSAPKSGPTCPAGVTAPILTYGHDPDGACCQNASITGGEVIRSSKLPASLSAAYIYGDYAQRQIRYATFNSNGTVAQDAVLKATPNYQPVWIGKGPDGHIYYIHFSYSGSTGELRRLRYTGSTSNSAPVITQAEATPTSGDVPLTVAFRATASDADGDAVSYLWEYGDGTSGPYRNPSHTYRNAGTYNARLTVTAGGQTTFSSTIPITVGQAPSVTITSPVHQSSFVGGQIISLTGTATDNGPLTDSSYKWDVSFVHDNHVHPAMSGLSGASRTFTIPRTGHDFSGDTSYLVSLTVTDSSGASTTETVEIEPRKRSISVANSPTGITTTKIDGVTRNTPFTLDTLQGFRHTIEALASACVGTTTYNFASWNIGGNRSRTYTVPNFNQSVTASYSAGGSCGGPSVSEEPTVSWNAPFAGATSSSPAQVSSPVVLSGVARDNKSVDRVTVLIQNVATGRYLNKSTGVWQTSAVWFLVANPTTATTVNWSSSVGLAAGTYRSLVNVWDYDGNRTIPAAQTYFTVGNSTTTTTTTPPTTTTTAPTTTTTTTTTTQPPSGNDTTRPTHLYNAPYAGTTRQAPASVGSNVTLSGKASDNVALERVRIQIRDLGTGRYWNPKANKWQKKGSWITVANVTNGARNRNWSYSFTPRGGTGVHHVAAEVTDAAGNKMSPNMLAYFNTP